MRNAIIILLLPLFITTVLYAQEKKLLTADQFIALVQANHPQAKRADIQVEKAEAALLSARGNFDPSITLDASRKTFDGKNYYFYTNPQLKIPTWLGIDIKAGVESNGGYYLNPETTAGNTSYLGLELPLAKGLTMDKRRAGVQQSKIEVSQSAQEKLYMLNDLLFDAYGSYWQWAGSFALYNLYEKYIAISAQRFRLVRIAFDNGDKSAMDTLEAFTQLQNFKLLRAEAAMKLNDANIMLSNYIWSAPDSIALVQGAIVPDTIQLIADTNLQPVDDFVKLSNTQNPVLRSTQLKLEYLDIERRLKFQNLLPVVNAKANLLNKEYNVFKGVNSAFIQNNYKWGIDIKIPLFLRDGRGAYKEARLKIEETQYTLDQKTRETENKIRSYYNQFNQMQEQLQLMRSVVQNYQLLLQQEEVRFRAGESSLFLINSRENKMIEAMQKLIELQIKYKKAIYAVYWASGMLV